MQVTQEAGNYWVPDSLQCRTPSDFKLL